MAWCTSAGTCFKNQAAISAVAICGLDPVALRALGVAHIMLVLEQLWDRSFIADLDVQVWLFVTETQVHRNTGNSGVLDFRGVSPVSIEGSM
jgi:hypothetical protein